MKQKKNTGKKMNSVKQKRMKHTHSGVNGTDTAEMKT